MMKKYEKYKDSGIDWLGEIPEHWELRANKYNFQLKKKQVGKRSNEYDLLSLTLKGVIKRDMENPEGKFPAEFDTYQEVKINDFVFCLFDVEETPRTVGLSPFNGMITGAYTVMEPQSQINALFMYYYYLNADDKKQLKYLYRGLRNTIPKESFFSLKSAIPPLHEQEAIANFLDGKCEQLDALVGIKESQIEKLKELRQAKIHHAVTKGLSTERSRSAHMKDSGIDWIDEIPEHWEMKRLKNVLSSKLKYGANESGFEYDENLPRYIRISDFGFDGKLNETKKLSLPFEKAKDYYLKDGDILFARSGATVGKAYQFKLNLSLEKYYCFAGYLIKAEPDVKQILSDFLNYYTQSGAFLNWKDSIFNKATIENIGADKYSELNVPIPPISEQEAIVSYLDGVTGKIDEAIAQKQTQIQKLKEYKQSLINEVVTGKLRVG